MISYHILANHLSTVKYVDRVPVATTSPKTYFFPSVDPLGMQNLKFQYLIAHFLGMPNQTLKLNLVMT